MKIPQLIQYLNNLAGVEGCYVASSDGGILGKEMSSIFDDEILSEVAVNVSNVMETFKAELSACKELHFEMELKRLYVRDLGDSLLLVLVDELDQLANIRVAANVVAKRFDRGGEQASPERTPVQTTTSLFGPRRKKETKPKPAAKDGGGGIWG